MPLKYIDVSTWQGAIDWQKVKSDGVEGAILRATFGWDVDTQVDKRFYENVSGAKKAGVPIGAYHYSYAKNADEARSEANFFINKTKDINFELPVFYDIEDSSQSSLSSEQLSDVACAFCETLESNGYFVGIYASTSWMKRFNYDRIKRYTLWVAQYYSVCQYPNKHDMWQYTSSGSVAGISGRVDMNHCYRDYYGEIKNRGGNPMKTVNTDNELIAKLTAENLVLTQKLAQMTEKCNSLQLDLSTKQAENVDLSNRLNAKQAELVKLNGDLSAKQSQIDQLKTELSTKQAENVDLSNRLNAKQAELVKLNSDLSAKQSQIDQLKTELSAKQSQIDKLVSDLNELCKKKNGDINGDGKVDTKDVLLLMRSLVKK